MEYQIAAMTEAKTVLITGGANGIGWACAQEFLRAGWSVVIGDRDTDAAETRTAASDGSLYAVQLDVRDQNSVEAAVAAAVARYGRIHALVNNAGIQQWTSLLELDWETWSTVLDVNLNGTLRCLHVVGRHMSQVGGGAIVNIASISAERGIRYRAPYSVSKAAILALTRSAAVEWAEKNIRVNAVGPGYVATELIEAFAKSGKLDVEAVRACIPMSRLAEPAEIARAVLFLASDQGSYVTGQTLFVDGGFLANSGLPGSLGANQRGRT